MTRTGVRSIEFASLLGVSLWAAHLLTAQELAPTRFSTRTSAVVVDVVVRDRQHRPVRALTADDFDLYEDGVHQAIASFDVIDEPSGRRPTFQPALPPRPAGSHGCLRKCLP